MSSEVWNVKGGRFRVSKRNPDYDQKPTQSEVGKCAFSLPKPRFLSIRAEGGLLFLFLIWLWQGDTFGRTRGRHN